MWGPTGHRLCEARPCRARRGPRAFENWLLAGVSRGQSRPACASPSNGSGGQPPRDMGAEAGEPHFRELEPAGQVVAAESRAFDGRRESLDRTLPWFAPVEDAEHQNGAAIVPVLKGVCGAQHLKEEFTVLLAACYGSSQLRMSAEDVSPLDKFVRHASREVGKPFVENAANRSRSAKGSSDHSISLARPRSKPGRAPRAEPLHHTVMRHARAFRGPG